MRRGFMGMMLKPRCNRRSGWGKGVLDQKKHGWAGQRSRCCWLCFFNGKVQKNTVVPGSFSAFEGCYAQEEAWIVGKTDLDVAPRQCAGSRSLLIHSYLAKHQTSVVPHPPYSPDLAPEDLFLSPKLKTTFKGRRFQTIEEIQENATIELRAITSSAFQEAFQKWKKRWERCIASSGDYFEGDSA